jgi:hypothetical protein
MKQRSLPFRDASREQGETAAVACAAAAEKKGWDLVGAKNYILGYLIKFGRQSGEQLVNAAREAGFIPHDDRAFGPVFSGLSRKGLIRCVGYGCREKGNGTAGARVWEAV